jgi:hypothetical protein
MIRKILIALPLICYNCIASSEDIKFSPEAELKKNCNQQSSSSCVELGLSKLQQKKNKEAYQYFKQACDKENYCSALASYYAGTGKLKEAREVLSKGCEGNVMSCYELAYFERNHGDQKAYLTYLKKACDIKYNDATCKKEGIKNHSEATKYMEELKKLTCKGKGCSDFEKKTSRAAEVFMMLKSRNESCAKNDGQSCFEFAELLHQMELETKNEDKKELDLMLNKLEIKENSDFYMKKACKLKIRFACNEAKK